MSCNPTVKRIMCYVGMCGCERLVRERILWPVIPLHAGWNLALTYPTKWVYPRVCKMNPPQSAAHCKIGWSFNNASKFNLKEADSSEFPKDRNNVLRIPFPDLCDPACNVLPLWLPFPRLHEIQTTDMSCNLIVNACEGTIDGGLILQTMFDEQLM